MKATYDHAAASFNLTDAGTSEHLWHSVLGNAAALILPEAEILVVSPNPDDEILGAGGLIRTAAMRAHSVCVLSVTDGESGLSGVRGLRRLRRREVKHALTVLSPWPVKSKHLHIPDGRVAQHEVSLFDAVNRMASHTTLLVAPFEQDGHPDHEATGEVCAEIARQRGLPLWRYPIWAWHRNAPDQLADRAWGRFWLDPDTQRAKGMAMDCVGSQLRPESRTPIVPPHVLEHFTRPYEAFLV